MQIRIQTNDDSDCCFDPAFWSHRDWQQPTAEHFQSLAAKLSNEDELSIVNEGRIKATHLSDYRLNFNKLNSKALCQTIVEAIPLSGQTPMEPWSKHGYLFSLVFQHSCYFPLSRERAVVGAGWARVPMSPGVGCVVYFLMVGEECRRTHTIPSLMDSPGGCMLFRYFTTQLFSECFYNTRLMWNSDTRHYIYIYIQGI